MNPRIRTVCAHRYVTPLREGGSLPALIEADDEGLYVLKFRGAAQGPAALIAEWVSGEIGRALGLPVPQIVFVELDEALARTEPDPQVQQLIRRSAGLNLALAYLPGSVTHDPLAHPIDPALAARIVWFDGFVTNIDRTPRNANLLMWQRTPWLIDHGASLYFQHQWGDPATQAVKPFAMIKDHVLLPVASSIAEADKTLPQRLPSHQLRSIIEAIPQDWLQQDSPFSSIDEHREAFIRYFERRLEHPRAFAKEADSARNALHL